MKPILKPGKDRVIVEIFEREKSEGGIILTGDTDSFHRGTIIAGETNLHGVD